MTRATTLTTGALLGLTLLAPTGAGAAGETCQGRPATIVGTPGAARRRHRGRGRDRDRRRGSGSSALGGDDLICVTGAQRLPRRRRRTVTCGGRRRRRPGRGDDPRLGHPGTPRPRRATATSVPSGSTRTRSGRRRPPLGAADVEVDTVAGHLGRRDGLLRHRVGCANSDVVEIGAGTLQWTGFMTAAGRASGGTASALRTTARSGDALDRRGPRDRRHRDVQRDLQRVRRAGVRHDRRQGHREVPRHRRHRLVQRRGRDTYDRIVDMRGGSDFYASTASATGGAGTTGAPAATCCCWPRRARTSTPTWPTAGSWHARAGGPSGARSATSRAWSSREEREGPGVAARRGDRRHRLPRGRPCRRRVRTASASRPSSSAGTTRPAASRRGFVDGGPGNDVLRARRGATASSAGRARDIADGRQRSRHLPGREADGCEVRR